MATNKKELSLQELVESHRPKNFKYYFYFHNPDDVVELEKNGFDVTLLDTICNPELIQAAKQATFKYYERDIVAHAKEPTILEKGVIMTKQMATKTDKKLSQVGVAFFSLMNVEYVAVKLCYDKFDIYEIFILT
jgi:hypothetical protein